jgi:hypothetical protein
MEHSGLGRLKRIAPTGQMHAFFAAPTTLAAVKLYTRTAMGPSAKEEEVTSRAVTFMNCLWATMEGGAARTTEPTYYTLGDAHAAAAAAPAAAAAASSSSSSSSSSAAAAAAAAERELDLDPIVETQLDAESLLGVLLDATGSVARGNEDVAVRAALSGLGLPLMEEEQGEGAGLKATQQSFIDELPQRVEGVLQLLRARGGPAFAAYDPRRGGGRASTLIPACDLAQLNCSMLAALAPINPGAVDMKSIVCVGLTAFPCKGPMGIDAPDQHARIRDAFCTSDPMVQEAARRHALSNPPSGGGSGGGGGGGGEGGGSGSGGGSSSSSSSSYLTARKVVELNNTGWGFHGPLSEAVGPRHGESATFSPASVLGATSAKALAHTAKAMVPFLGLFAPPRFVTWDVKPFGYASWDVNGVRLDSWQDRATAWFSV